MAALTVETIGPHGGELQDISFTAVSASDTFVNSGRELIIIKNGDGSPRDSVVVSVADEYGRTGDLTITTANAEQSTAGPFPTRLWNNGGGLVTVTHAYTTSITIAVVQYQRS